jgi:hypothetical protein
MIVRSIAVPLLAVVGSVAFAFLIIFALPLLLFLILNTILHLDMLSSAAAYSILVVLWVLALSVR